MILRLIIFVDFVKKKLSDEILDHCPLPVKTEDPLITLVM